MVLLKVKAVLFSFNMSLSNIYNALKKYGLFKFKDINVYYILLGLLQATGKTRLREVQES